VSLLVDRLCLQVSSRWLGTLHVFPIALCCKPPATVFREAMSPRIPVRSGTVLGALPALCWPGEFGSIVLAGTSQQVRFPRVSITTTVLCRKGSPRPSTASDLSSGAVWSSSRHAPSHYPPRQKDQCSATGLDPCSQIRMLWHGISPNWRSSGLRSNQTSSCFPDELRSRPHDNPWVCAYTPPQAPRAWR